MLVCLGENKLLICVIVICASEALIVNNWKPEGIDSTKVCISVCLCCPMEGENMCMASPRRAPNSPRRLEGGGAPQLALPP